MFVCTKMPKEQHRLITMQRIFWRMPATCANHPGAGTMTLRGLLPLKNLIGQFGVLHPLHPQCGCSSEKMCEQRTWTVCCFLLGPKPITLESIGYQP